MTTTTSSDFVLPRTNPLPFSKDPCVGKGGVSPPAPPGTQAEAIVNRVEVVVQTENLVRKAILEGMPPKEAYLQYRKF